MNREEALSRGMKVHETKHSMKRRSPWHDYYRVGTYMLTLVVEGRKPVLGELEDELDVEISEQEVSGIRTVGEAANYLEQLKEA